MLAIHSTLSRYERNIDQWENIGLSAPLNDRKTCVSRKSFYQKTARDTGGSCDSSSNKPPLGFSMPYRPSILNYDLKHQSGTAKALLNNGLPPGQEVLALKDAAPPGPPRSTFRQRLLRTRKKMGLDYLGVLGSKDRMAKEVEGLDVSTGLTIKNGIDPITGLKIIDHNDNERESGFTTTSLVSRDESTEQGSKKKAYGNNLGCTEDEAYTIGGSFLTQAVMEPDLGTTTKSPASNSSPNNNSEEKPTSVILARFLATKDAEDPPIEMQKAMIKESVAQLISNHKPQIFFPLPPPKLDKPTPGEIIIEALAPPTTNIVTDDPSETSLGDSTK